MGMFATKRLKNNFYHRSDAAHDASRTPDPQNHAPVGAWVFAGVNTISGKELLFERQYSYYTAYGPTHCFHALDALYVGKYIHQGMAPNLAIKVWSLNAHMPLLLQVPNFPQEFNGKAWGIKLQKPDS